MKTYQGKSVIQLIAVAFFLLVTSAAAGQSDPLQRLEIERVGNVFATQGQAVITQSDFDAYLQSVPGEHRSGFLMSNERIGKALQSMVLARLIANRTLEGDLLEDEIREARLYQSTMVFLADLYRRHYLDSHLLDDYTQSAREVYLTEPEVFEADPAVSFTHILVNRGRGRGELEAMEQIFSVYERLQAGKSVEDLVEAFSDDPGKEENQGQYRDVKLEELDENVAQMLKLMQPGQISEPVLSESGWHIIRLDEKNDARQLDWEEAKPEAIEIARQRHQQELLERLYRQLLSENQLEVEPGALERLFERYDVRGADRPTTSEIRSHAKD